MCDTSVLQTSSICHITNKVIRDLILGVEQNCGSKGKGTQKKRLSKNIRDRFVMNIFCFKGIEEGLDGGVLNSLFNKNIDINSVFGKYKVNTIKYDIS